MSKLRLLRFSELIELKCTIEQSGRIEYEGNEVKVARNKYEYLTKEQYPGVKYTKTTIKLLPQAQAKYPKDIEAITGYIISRIPEEIKDMITMQMKDEKITQEEFLKVYDRFPDFFTTAPDTQLDIDVQIIKKIAEIYNNQPAIDLDV